MGTNYYSIGLHCFGVTISNGTGSYGLSGTKTSIKATETLDIPVDFDYNTFKLDVEGTVNLDGTINFI